MDFPRRVRLFALLLLFLNAALAANLGRIMIVGGGGLSQRAVDQRAVAVDLGAVRGGFYDRNMQPLTYRDAGYKVVAVPGLMDDPVRAAKALAAFSAANGNEEDSEELGAKLASAKALATSGVYDAQAGEAIRALGIPGVCVADVRLRYPAGGLLAHVLGHTDPRGRTGVSGLEFAFDEILAGGGGDRVGAFVDGTGRLMSGLGYRRLGGASEPFESARPGIKTTLDLSVQQAVERVMNDMVRKGAVVVMDPYTGDVLAMASRPSYDPNNPANHLDDDGSPFLNRAVCGFAPGSVFKVLIACAALSEGAAAPDDLFYDPGWVDVGKVRFSCSAEGRGGHGYLTFESGLATSCNSVFIETGLRLGATRILAWAEKLGFGARTGVGLPEESPGKIPRAWGMSDQDVANLSIGQGQLLATPLQVAVMTCAIANGGFLVRPRLADAVALPDGTVQRAFVRRPKERVLDPEVASELSDMMRSVVESGTGRLAEVTGLFTAGKTGTAETGRRDPGGKTVCHAWFTGFAPYGDPRIVVTVLVEEGGSGGDVAAPVFQRIVVEVLGKGDDVRDR